jgi:signal transduction histidine kinase/ActR/RegA family two-component response regulator
VSRDREGAPVSEGGEPRGEVREELRDLGRRLDAMGIRLARVEQGVAAGEPLDERARRGLRWLESAFAISPDGPPGAALDLALDRVIYGAGADCAAVFVPTVAGALEPIAQRGFRAPPASLPPGQGLGGRAFAEGDLVQGNARHHAADPLLAEHGLGHALAVPLGRPPAAPLGVLFAARRRAAPFDGRALAVLALVADRAGLVLERLRARPADEPDEAGPGADLDLAATAERVARAMARRLGAPAVAVLLPEGSALRVAGAVGLPLDRIPPPPDAEPCATILAGGPDWRAGDDEPAPPPLAAFLGAAPRLVLPLRAGDATVALVVAGGPTPVDVALAAPLVTPAAHALRNARLHAETVAALGEHRAGGRRGAEPAGPARDFLGLLAVLLARVGLVRERVTDPELTGDLALAEEAAWRAAEAVRGFLGFAPGARTESLRPLDLAEVVSGAVADAVRRAEARGERVPEIGLEVEPLPPVRGDGDELREALGRLLDNGVEAVAGGGEISVRARWDVGRRVEVVVEDTGPGMEEAVRTRVLEPFFSTRGAGRLGLGLPVVQAIVERHRGTLEVASAPGQGTRVRMLLPTAAGASSRPAAALPARILVVEDEAAVREALVEALTRHGHVALAAADGEEALALLQRGPFEAAVVDLALAGRSGLEVAQAAKRMRAGTPVIVVTAWPGQLHAAAVRASGVDQVLEKPVAAAQVLDALERLLAARRGVRA